MCCQPQIYNEGVYILQQEIVLYASAQQFIPESRPYFATFFHRWPASGFELQSTGYRIRNTPSLRSAYLLV